MLLLMLLLLPSAGQCFFVVAVTIQLPMRCPSAAAAAALQHTWPE
jgi:hypothetical protein